MELRYIRILVTFAQNGFSGAAKELNMSKGVLSKYLSKIEEILGVPLYERSGGKMQLNEQGKIVYKTAKKILAVEEEYLQQLGKRKNQEKHVLSVGSIMQMSQYNIMKKLLEFHKLYPEAVLDVRQMQGNELLLEALSEEQIEIAFVRNGIENVENSEFDSRLYCVDRYCFVLPESHPLAGERAIRPEQLKDEKFILLPERATVSREFLHIAHEAGFEPNVIAQFEGGDNIQDAVQEGYGISVLTRMPTEYHKKSHRVALVNMEPDRLAPIYMVRLKTHKLSDIAVKFWNYIEMDGEWEDEERSDGI